jgi:hypothetical protein
MERDAGAAGHLRTHEVGASTCEPLSCAHAPHATGQTLQARHPSVISALPAPRPRTLGAARLELPRHKFETSIDRTYGQSYHKATPRLWAVGWPRPRH